MQPPASATPRPDPADYVPLARKAAARWLRHYRRKGYRQPLTFNDFFSDAQLALVKAAARYRDDLPACGDDGCLIPLGGIRCAHGFAAYNFAALANRLVNGACSHLVRAAKRRGGLMAQYYVARGSGQADAYGNINDSDGARLAKVAKAMSITPDEIMDIISAIAEGNHTVPTATVLTVLRKLRASKEST